VNQAVEVKGLKVLAARLDGADAKTLRDTLDKLKDKLGSAAIVLATVDGDKVQLAAGVTRDAVGRVKAGELVVASPTWPWPAVPTPRRCPWRSLQSRPGWPSASDAPAGRRLTG